MTKLDAWVGRHFLAGIVRPLLEEGKATMGTLANLDTHNPCVYLDFPEGRARLNGYRQHLRGLWAQLPPRRSVVARRRRLLSARARTRDPALFLVSAQLCTRRQRTHSTHTRIYACHAHFLLTPCRSYPAAHRPGAGRLLNLECKSSELHVTDQFEHLLLFSELVWVGTKDENPDETPLPFPASVAKVRCAALRCVGCAHCAPRLRAWAGGLGIGRVRAHLRAARWCMVRMDSRACTRRPVCV